jgi:hypothetical protein
VTIFETSRRFEVVTWGPGHRGLLLRSTPTEVVAPDVPFDRIEVWFKPAEVVCLPVHFDGLVIDDADRETQADIAQILGRDLDPWENAYVVGTSSGAAGWVVGGSVNGRSDIQTFDAPTMFDGWAAHHGVTELFSYKSR